MKKAILICLLLTSCNRDDGKCQSYGAKPGTPEYVNCRASLQAAKMNALLPGLLR